MALGTFWALNIAFAAVSAALLVALLYIYGRNATQIKSKFTVGLVLFAVLFLVQNVAGRRIYFSLENAGVKADVAGPPSLLTGDQAGGLRSLRACHSRLAHTV